MWIIFLTICVPFISAMSLVLCLCWRKKTPKNEWQGLDGMVTQKNPDENVNHLPSAAPCVVDLNACGDSLDSNRRSVITNTRRSLPDIPSEQGNNVNWEPNGDNSSEHYATVGQYQNSKRHTIANGDARPSISQHSSMSQADEFSPYERVKYDKIKSNKEHPYAQLQPNNRAIVVTEESQDSSDEGMVMLRPDLPSSSEPTAPPRSRRSSNHSGQNLEIPAASAVAGGVAASPELPYMTPPVTQANFSGDSQDSSKGYTSISVREPLANIMAQTSMIKKQRRHQDPHYATVSDDSDDVYTTIPDPNNQIYTSESETYAQIPNHPIIVEAEVNISQPVERDEVDEIGDLYEPAPQPAPPSVDSLKQVTGHHFTHTHSRQASTSSSIANIGSPKPEKRQANSPLPPPPTTSSFEFHSDKLQAMRNIDDLYAKVHKIKNNESNVEKSLDKPSSDINNRNIIASSSTNLENKKPEQTYRRKEHNYETLKKSPRKVESDPGYEKIKNDRCNSEEPGYASINGPESINSTDPGYEVLKQRIESDPDYEQLRHRVSNASDSEGYARIRENILMEGYSVVKKRSKPKEKVEPNYESMPSNCITEPNYAAIGSNGSDTDPNYESVSNSDPNYESVKELDDPPYERLDEDSSRTDSDLVAYEKIKTKAYDNSSDSSTSAAKSLSDPPYETFNNNDTDSEVPGYERIQNNSIRTGDSLAESEPNYSTINSKLPGYERNQNNSIKVGEGSISENEPNYSTIKSEGRGKSTTKIQDPIVEV